MAQITLWGMYQYDPTLFDNIRLPDGVDKEILIGKIMRTSGMLFPYHQVPPTFKKMIGYWFSAKWYDFSQMYAALHAQYNPIENYDRKEDITRTHADSGSDVETNALGSTSTLEHGMKQTYTPGITDTTMTQVSAFDSSDYQNRDKVTSDHVGEDETVNSGADVTKRGGQDTRTTQYGKGWTDHDDVYVHGNIGVTTAQQMITAEIQMRTDLDLYNVICTLFEQEFLLQVY